MARVTVKDCLDNVNNRFGLVMLAAKHARQLAAGGKEPKVIWENDKPTVVVLRKIASGLADKNVIQQEGIVKDEPLSAAFDDEADTEAL